MTESLAEEDFESAAHHVHRYLKLDKESLRLKSSDLIDDMNEKNNLDYSFQLLQESKTRLQQIVNEKYDLAVQSNDIPQMERFFKIFPLIGLAESGLDKFATYLCNQIRLEAEKNYVLLNSSNKDDPRWGIIFADALILHFERVARMIEAYQPVIQSSYGYGHIFGFIKKIQLECDLQAVKILNKFKETRSLNQVFRMVQNSVSSGYSSSAQSQSGGQSLATNSRDDKLDPRSLDELLTELTLISARVELYKSFLIKSILNDLDSQQANDEQVLKSTMIQIQTFFNSTNLQCSVQELIGQYSILENYFMIENIYKAIQMDTMSKRGLTSSVVDDVFFIIKKCIK